VGWNTSNQTLTSGQRQEDWKDHRDAPLLVECRMLASSNAVQENPRLPGAKIAEIEQKLALEMLAQGNLPRAHRDTVLDRYQCQR
jgi:hypothetical protein